MATFTKMATEPEVAPVKRDEEEQAEVALCVDKLRSKIDEEMTNENPTFESSDLSDGAENEDDPKPPSAPSVTSGEIRRDRPFSASMVSRRSRVSVSSRASLSPNIVTTEFASKNMFAYRVIIANNIIIIIQLLLSLVLLLLLSLYEDL